MEVTRQLLQCGGTSVTVGEALRVRQLPAEGNPPAALDSPPNGVPWKPAQSTGLAITLPAGCILGL
ncbi:hypothetical protein LC593_00820 [Nostoc sp. CHAB 5844]|nr:hypothetical protein [Nostoc sp. CHAB 5844]